MFIFAKKTNGHFVKGNLNSDYYRNEVGSHHGDLWSEKWPCFLARQCTLPHNYYVHRVPVTGGTFKPAIVSITEVFAAIEFSNVFF